MKPTDLLERGRLVIEDGELFALKMTGKYDGYYNNNIDPVAFHFAIWLTQNDYANFSVSMRLDYKGDEHDRKERVILFGDRAGYEEYQTWIKDYRKRFPDEDWEQKCVPSLPTSGRYNLTFVSIEKEDASSANVKRDWEQDQFEHWGWVIQNCTGLVFKITGTEYAFENEDEAFLFKMLHHL